MDSGGAEGYPGVVRNRRELVATITISTVIGAVAAVVLVVLLARPTGVLLTGGCGYLTLVRDDGFDPWTGQPHGQVIESDCLGSHRVSTSPPPEDLQGRVGVPWATLIVVAVILGSMVAGRAISKRRWGSDSG